MVTITTHHVVTLILARPLHMLIIVCHAYITKISSSPLPQYFALIIMARGDAEYILSAAAEATLAGMNPGHPRIKLSNAAKLALNEIILRFEPPTDGSRITSSKVPRFVIPLVRSFNLKFLRANNDKKLNHRNLWRIFYRRQFGRNRSFQSTDSSLSHKAIYIQQRYSHHDEALAGVQKRKKAINTNPIGSDYRNIQKVTTIDQANSARLIYLCKNLHSRYHGSIHHSDITNKKIIYQFVGIPHKTLAQKTTGPRAVAKDDDVIAAFPNAAYFRNLTTDLLKGGHNDLSTFENKLAAYIMEHGTTRDVGRCNGIIDADMDSINQRIRFGFGRLQRASLGINLDYNGTPLPGLNVRAFLNMPASIRHPLMALFNASTQFTKTWMKDSFSDNERNSKCAGLLNRAVGCPNATSLFEYFDIVVTRNTILQKHLDVKNDHRPGYNLCCVYSFYTTTDHSEVKVSIIMTTRTTVGSAVHNSWHKN